MRYASADVQFAAAVGVDGVNDGPALAAATVAIAIKAILAVEGRSDTCR